MYRYEIEDLAHKLVGAVGIPLPHLVQEFYLTERIDPVVSRESIHPQTQLNSTTNNSIIKLTDWWNNSSAPGSGGMG